MFSMGWVVESLSLHTGTDAAWAGDMPQSDIENTIAEADDMAGMHHSISGRLVK